MIRKHGSSYRIFSSAGKVLGTYKTYKEAKNRLSQMEYFSGYKNKRK